MNVSTHPSSKKRILIIGSGPNALEVCQWNLSVFDRIVVINNAWQVTQNWHDLIYPHDFPPARLPPTLDPPQRLVDESAFVPAQNHYGGFVYAGGTMAFTTAYWVLKEYAPAEICFIGCDMHYPAAGPTHFYGIGQPDPLRADISLTSLEGSSARFMCLSAKQGCAVFNLSNGPSRLIFPRRKASELNCFLTPATFNRQIVEDCLSTEQQLGYFVADGRYWLVADRFDAKKLRQLNKNWLLATGHLQDH